MANIKITDLAAYTDPASTDVLPIVDVGADVTKKISIADLLENAGSGTAAAPGIAFDGDSDTGIYSPGADQLAISTNGTGRLFVDANGNIGTTATPGALLDLAANNTGLTSPLTAKNRLRFTDTDTAQTNNQPTGAIEWYTSDTDSPGVHAYISTDMFNSGTGSLVVGTGNGGSATQKLAISAQGNVSITADAATPPLIASIGGSEVVRIDSSGRLGLGTSSPQHILQVFGSAPNTNIAHFGRTGGNLRGLIIGTRASGAVDDAEVILNAPHASGSINLFTANSQRVTVTNAGNVGIGTTTVNANAKLHTVGGNILAQGDGGANTATLILSPGSTPADGANIAVSYSGSGSYGPLKFGTGGPERARIDSDGRLLVGTSTSIQTDALIQTYVSSGKCTIISASDSLSDNDISRLLVRGTTGAATRFGQFAVAKHSGITNPIAYVEINSEDSAQNFIWADNSGVLRISSTFVHTGTTSGTVVGTQTSDERVKNVLGPVTYGLDTIKQIDPVRYALKSEPDTEKIGFIAQQVQPLVPESVFDTKEYIEGEPEDAPTKLGMEYVALIPVLVNAIKELSAEVDALKAQLQAS